MEVKNIPIEQILPNSYNPNAISPEVMLQLKNSIKRDGFLQPLVVKVDPKDVTKYIIIDGEHRYNVLKELEYKEVPSLVVSSDDNLAKIQTINMNKLRGEFDSIKLAEVLVSLKKVYSDEQIEDLLGFDKEEINTYDELLNFELKKGEDKIDTIIDGLEEPVIPLELNLTLTPYQQEIIIAALREKALDSQERCLTAICRDYLIKANKSLMEQITAKYEQMEIDKAKPDVSTKDKKEIVSNK